MEYRNDFEVEFVKRTIDLINALSDSTNLEVTLLINCLYGLIVIPTEKRYPSGKYRDYKKACINHINKYASCVKPNNNNNSNNSSEQLIKCMKNALSHLHIEIASDLGQIAMVKFGDKGKTDLKYHTELEFTVENLKKYALDIAKSYLEIILGQNPQQIDK